MEFIKQQGNNSRIFLKILMAKGGKCSSKEIREEDLLKYNSVPRVAEHLKNRGCITIKKKKVGSRKPMQHFEYVNSALPKIKRLISELE